MKGKPSLKKIAEDYFRYMSRRFPVMCLSDEFHFLPRAENSIHHLKVLDSLDRDKIKKDINYVTALRNRIDRLKPSSNDLEYFIDYTVLRQSMSTFLIHFDLMKIWRHDPTLYIKIVLLGVNQLLNKYSPGRISGRPDLHQCLLSRLKQIPRLLKEAADNLHNIPGIHLNASLALVDTSMTYFAESPFSKGRLNKFDREARTLNKKIIESFLSLRGKLHKTKPHPGTIKDKSILNNILRRSFCYKKGLYEIFDIAGKEYSDTLKELTRRARVFPGKQSWQNIVAGYDTGIKDIKGLSKLYSGQVITLRAFFSKKNILPLPEQQRILVLETPDFMRPMRASASYACPSGINLHEQGCFYFTPCFPGTGKSGSIKPGSIHNEFIFVTAHETFPGHHLLDYTRQHLKNPIRRQIESPFFYEGWASYSESLIIKLGYVKDPVHYLIGLRRQAWRAVRAMLDTGLWIKKITPKKAEEMLKYLGYSPTLAKGMIKHYLLTCGYQLCYTIGKYEIEKLEKTFLSRLGAKRFYSILLKGGQIPFHLVKRRMEEHICKKNS